MKIHLLSDLHNEFAPFQPDAAAVSACDIVVLAGDIDKGVRGIEWARKAFATKPVIYVCGNHEFYSHHWTGLLSELKEEAARWDVCFLEDRAIDIGGVRFLGCALWSDFAFFPNEPLHHTMRTCERGMNDFRLIGADPLPVPAGTVAGSMPARVRFGKRLTAMHVRARHQASVRWLREQLRIANEEGTRPVVVTHHLPSARSVAPEYAQDSLTPAFASHLDDLIPAAQLWLHGHTHDSFDYPVQTSNLPTRVVCNPRGYPRSAAGSTVAENASFDPALILEI